jgi:FHS family L-fucose permease-like MFS transporter
LAVPLRNVSAPGYNDDLTIKTDTRAMSVATALFFMVGFLTCLNDVISPHLKSIFGLNYSETQAIPFFFFSSYFVFSYPGGKLVEKVGYKKSMVIGLLIMAAGALGFLPAAHLAVFSLFLTALVVLAAGMTVVQVAINPYVSVIGPAATAASRLNLAQAVNSFGTFIAPFIGTYLILRNAQAPATTAQLLAMSSAQRQGYRVLQASTVQTPYLIIAVALVLLALALAAIKLKPQTGQTDLTQDFRPGAFAEALNQPKSIWKHKWVIFGALGIFTYVGAEVSIGNLLVSYMGLPSIGALPEATAGYFLMVYWGGAMVGRFVGAAVLQKVRTGPVLTFAAIGAFLLVVLSLLTTGHLAMGAILAVGFCNSIMFPSIFTLGIQDLGPLTSKGSSILIAAILGGAIVPKIQGIVADIPSIGLHKSFFVPAICYVYLAGFAIAAIKRPAAKDALLPVEPV